MVQMKLNISIEGTTFFKAQKKQEAIISFLE